MISFILASTAARTVRLLAPISISAVPITTSWPFLLALPVRSSRPIADLGDVPETHRNAARVDRTTSPMSSMVSRRPAVRTTKPSPLRSI